MKDLHTRFMIIDAWERDESAGSPQIRATALRGRIDPLGDAGLYSGVAFDLEMDVTRGGKTVTRKLVGTGAQRPPR